jgi:uncharacterized protein (UPF0335 family)
VTFNRDAVSKSQLPDAYADVIERLDDSELACLTKVKESFDEAESMTGADAASYRAYFWPF